MSSRTLPFEERARTNFDAPEAIDQDLLAAQLAVLAGGGEVATPVCDFARHTRAAEVRRVRPSGFVILESLFALYWPDIRKLLSTNHPGRPRVLRAPPGTRRLRARPLARVADSLSRGRGGKRRRPA